jgi:hypothetical protein
MEPTNNLRFERRIDGDGRYKNILQQWWQREDYEDMGAWLDVDVVDEEL